MDLMSTHYVVPNGAAEEVGGRSLGFVVIDDELALGDDVVESESELRVFDWV